MTYNNGNFNSLSKPNIEKLKCIIFSQVTKLTINNTNDLIQFNSLINFSCGQSVLYKIIFLNLCSSIINILLRFIGDGHIFITYPLNYVDCKSSGSI